MGQLLLDIFVSRSNCGCGWFRVYILRRGICGRGHAAPTSTNDIFWEERAHTLNSDWRESRRAGVDMVVLNGCIAIMRYFGMVDAVRRMAHFGQGKADGFSGRVVGNFGFWAGLGITGKGGGVQQWLVVGCSGAALGFATCPIASCG